MRLRLAILSDLPQMQKLYSETIQTVCINDYNQQQVDVWLTAVQNKARWDAVLKDQLVVIAEKNNQMVGFGTLRDGDYVDFLYVHKDFQRQGIAARILSQLEIQAQKTGNKNLTSDVSITARPFFEKKGFIVLQKQENLRNGIVLVNYKMEKMF